MTNMEFYILTRQRYSVRKFSALPIEDEKLNLVLEAGRTAPTAHNNQPQRIYVLKSAEAVAKIREITPCAFNAPVVLLLCGQVNEGWCNPYSGHNAVEMDVSIVTTQMMLQAAELGLGSTWVCHADFAKVKEAFSLPEGVEPYALMPLGYPQEGVKPSKLHEERKALPETVAFL